MCLLQFTIFKLWLVQLPYTRIRTETTELLLPLPFWHLRTNCFHLFWVVLSFTEISLILLIGLIFKTHFLQRFCHVFIVLSLFYFSVGLDLVIVFYHSTRPISRHQPPLTSNSICLLGLCATLVGLHFLPGHECLLKLSEIHFLLLSFNSNGCMVLLF